MTVVTRCRQCHQDFDADRAAILAGAWRLCPTCRVLPPDSPMPLEGTERLATRRCRRCRAAVAGGNATRCDLAGVDARN